ncbi:hypothetical protein ACFC8N_42605 [Streptomyces sp. NPDC055966]|uniref:hypothetical protein n=1 Tax=Streptomyces sp. NPDC055966 TaxID=3345669 RepID=UPI0035D5FD94
MKTPLRRLLAGLTLTAAIATAGLTATDIVATPQDDTGWGAPAGDTGWGSLPASSTVDSITSSVPLTDTAWG